MYTNKTASNLNLNLYSKQVGGSKCIKKCRQKCSENCGHFCRVAADDHDEHNEQYKKLETKLALLRQKAADSEHTKIARTMSSYRNTRVNSDLVNKILSSRSTTNEEKAALLRSLQGGRKTRRFRKRKVRGGFGFLGNTSEYKPCEDECTTSCSNNCELTCEGAVSKTSIHKEKIKLMKSEIELLEKLIRSNLY
jgi:hypothetical protein